MPPIFVRVYFGERYFEGIIYSISELPQTAISSCAEPVMMMTSVPQGRTGKCDNNKDRKFGWNARTTSNLYIFGRQGRMIFILMAQQT